MSYRIVVLAKQVPDTHNVGADAMNADGTVNRAALPTVFNPEDLKALEMALQVKDQVPGSTVTVVTSSPLTAAQYVFTNMIPIIICIKIPLFDLSHYHLLSVVDIDSPLVGRTIKFASIQRVPSMLVHG